MKAVIIDTFNYYELRTKYVYEELVRLGYEVTIIVSDFNHITKDKWQESREHTIYIPTKPYFKNISISRLKSHLDFAKKAYRQICIEKPDVIYCLLPLNSLAKKVHKYKKKHGQTKVFFDIYDLWPESMPVNSLIKSMLFPWRNLRDKHLKCADKIVLECSYYKKFLPKGLEYSVAYLCKEKREIGFKHDDDTLRFLYLGSINNIIDIDGIIKLLSYISKRRSTHLDIIGGGEAENEFVSKLKNSNIQFANHGRIFDEEKKDEIISRCHFGINMYKENLCIGLTMKSLDYFCRGLPIVSENIYDTKILIEKYNCGVDVREGIYDEVLDISEEGWQILHKNCLLAHSENFSEGSNRWDCLLGV